MKKTNSGLVAYAKAQVGKPYWYGTFGQTASESLYVSKKKQYPSYYTAQDFSSQYGKRVHDCVGLIKGYLWSDSNTATPSYQAAQDKSAKGMYQAATEKGAIATFPKKAGQLVFKGSSPSAITHVGVYDGSGYVYEAKGHAYGVVKSKFDSAWSYWAQCPYITDDTASETTTKKKSTYSGVYPALPPRGYYQLNDGITTLKNYPTQIKRVQAFLNWAMDSGLTVDGKYGTKTEAAVKAFQKKYGLTVDGKFGSKTLQQAKKVEK